MSDKDFAPLTAACVRSLNDKLYEKRKSAALEIERFVACCYPSVLLSLYERLPVKTSNMHAINKALILPYLQ